MKMVDLFSSMRWMCVSSVVQGGQFSPIPSTCRLTFRVRQREYESTEITVRVLGPSDKIPSADSWSHNPSEEEVTPFKYGSSNGWGLRQSKRLKRGKIQKEKKITIRKTTTAKEIKILVRSDGLAIFLTRELNWFLRYKKNLTSPLYTKLYSTVE
jgi:hypothetical protein